MTKIETRDGHGSVGQSLMRAVDELCSESEASGGVVVTWDESGELSMIMAGTFPDGVDDDPDVVAAAIFAHLSEELDPMEDDVRVRN